MWYDTLLKMDPVAYNNEYVVNYHNLLSKHDGQVVFASKVLPLVEKLDFENELVMNRLLSNYAMFLDICLTSRNAMNARNVPIVPTLIEDFVWHSHMLDHKDYVDMTTKMFGKILGHQTDLEMEKADRESKVVRDEYLKSKGLLQNDSGSMVGMAGIAGMAAMGVIAATHGHQRPHDRPTDKPLETQKTDGSTTSSDCAGTDLMGFGPSGILNPINPWNSINPISPYYSSHHSSTSSFTHSSNDISSHDSNHDSSNDSSSSCSSSCSSGGCGGD
jgi:hypothetical protein